MSTSTPTPLPFDPLTLNIDQLLGVILICLIIAAYLFGMSSSQAYIYYDRFPKDMWTYKILVGVVWALDSLHTALMSHTAYFYTVSNFGNFRALDEKPVFSFNLEIGIVPILAFIVQSYFAHRAFAVERSRRSLVLSACIEGLAVAQLVLGIAACVIAFTKFDGFFNIGSHSWALIAWLSTSALANLLVASSLCWSFYTHETAFSDEDGLLTKFLMYGVHTGVVTTLVTVVDLGFVVGWPRCMAFMGLNYILGKLYTNTLVYALNRRPITDPRYQSSSTKSKPANLSSMMPSFGAHGNANGTGGNNPHSLSTPRVQPKDPYAAGGPDLTFDNQKPYTLTDLEVQQDQHAQELDFAPDQRSEVSFVPQEKEKGRQADDVEGGPGAY